MTTTEYIRLRTTLLSVDSPEYSCAKCLKKYDHRKDGARMLEALQTVKGCEKPSTEPVLKLDGFAFRRCPGNFAQPSLLVWLEAHRAFRESGILPFPGSFVEQPNKVMDVFRVFDRWQNDKAIAEAKRRKLKGGERG